MPFCSLVNAKFEPTTRDKKRHGGGPGNGGAKMGNPRFFFFLTLYRLRRY